MRRILSVAECLLDFRKQTILDGIFRQYLSLIMVEFYTIVEQILSAISVHDFLSIHASSCDGMVFENNF